MSACFSKVIFGQERTAQSNSTVGEGIQCQVINVSLWQLHSPSFLITFFLHSGLLFDFHQLGRVDFEFDPHILIKFWIILPFPF